MKIDRMANRCAIYFFYDKDGVVDEYNIFLLSALKQVCDTIIIVVNGCLTECGKGKFLEVSSDLIVRENVGFDVWAYKAGLEYLGYENLSYYDELVMLNFTNYGPVFPFQVMFDEMADRDIDFWGIVMRYGFKNDPYKLCKYGYIPDHISSSFTVIRKSLLSQPEFVDYWKNMRPINGYEESICYHEAIFTQDFLNMGYVGDNYIDTEDLKEKWDYPLMMFPTELIKNRKCPIFKRKTFYNIYEEYFIAGLGNPAYELLTYLELETDYDMNLVYDNLLRTCNMWDLKERMQLNYIISTESLLRTELNKTFKVAIFLHIYFEDQIKLCYSYIEKLPLWTHIYITTDEQVKAEKIEAVFKNKNFAKLQITIIPNRGRDVSALLIPHKAYVYDYDYVCFCHDKKSNHIVPSSIGESFFKKCFDTLLGNEIVFNNVITILDRNPRIGIFSPTPPNHSIYYSSIGNEWSCNYENVKYVAGQYGVHVDITKDKPPVAPFGTMFWFRPDALKPLFDNNLQYEDFPEEPIFHDGTLLHAYERLYPYVAQSKGYFSVWGLTNETAKFELTNMYYVTREFNTVCFDKYGVLRREGIVNLIKVDKAKPFSNRALVKMLLINLLGKKFFFKFRTIATKIFRNI